MAYVLRNFYLRLFLFFLSDVGARTCSRASTLKCNKTTREAFNMNHLLSGEKRTKSETSVIQDATAKGTTEYDSATNRSSPLSSIPKGST
jgi:hypothetical protein